LPGSSVLSSKSLRLFVKPFVKIDKSGIWPISSPRNVELFELPEALDYTALTTNIGKGIISLRPTFAI
jgi:hypothetical protein